MFVIFTHFNWTEDDRIRFLFPFWIEMAVPIFMIITGYVSTMSWKNKDLSFREMYGTRELLAKWTRFILPFFITFVLEMLLLMLINDESFSIIWMIKLFVYGGEGPGSYYFPVMMQCVIILPLVYRTMDKYRGKALMFWTITNILFEASKTALDMSAFIYRLCALRYLFVLALGCYLFLEKRIKRKVQVLLGLCGFVYIYLFNYNGNFTPVITNMWRTTSVFASFYISVIMNYLLQLKTIKNNFLELLGRASYDIFLVQMIYYRIVAEMVYSIVSYKIVQLLIGFTFSVILGIFFYKVEAPIMRNMVKKIRGRNC